MKKLLLFLLSIYTIQTFSADLSFTDLSSIPKNDEWGFGDVLFEVFTKWNWDKGSFINFYKYLNSLSEEERILVLAVIKGDANEVDNASLELCSKIYYFPLPGYQYPDPEEICNSNEGLCTGSLIMAICAEYPSVEIAKVLRKKGIDPYSNEEKITEEYGSPLGELFYIIRHCDKENKERLEILKEKEERLEILKEKEEGLEILKENKERLKILINMANILMEGGKEIKRKKDIQDSLLQIFGENGELFAGALTEEDVIEVFKLCGHSRISKRNNIKVPKRYRDDEDDNNENTSTGQRKAIRSI